MKNLRSVLVGMMLLVCGVMCAQPQIIAHRGYWNTLGSAQNSIAALKDAAKLGIYGSEFDVHITKDNVVVVNHDNDIQGVFIEDANYAQIKHMKLANGETLPTLKQYLLAGKKLKGIQLILEIKAHKTPEKEDRCVAQSLKEVKETGMENRVEYISFSMHACEQIVKLDPKAKVYYLGGNVAPQEIKAKGFAGIDYHGGVLKKNPAWVEESHKLGMKVNVWTIDNLNQLRECVKAGVDFITTNKPVEAKKIAQGKL